MTSKQDNRKPDPPVRPRLYVSLLVVFLMIILLFMQQWDWLLAVFIGFLLGNGLSTLMERWK